VKNYKVAAVISGRGSTFMAFYEACQKGRLPGVNPAFLISTNSKAPGLQRAIDAGFSKSNIVLSQKSKFPDPLARGDALIEELRKRDIQLLMLMGCLMIVPPNVHEKIATLNQHPGRLPEFGGMDGLTVHCAAINFARSVKRFVTEPTVHLVTEQLDGGPVVDFRLVHFGQEVTPESLDSQVITVEHDLVQTTVYKFSQGRPGFFERTEPLARPGEENLLRAAIADAKEWAQRRKEDSR